MLWDNPVIILGIKKNTISSGLLLLENTYTGFEVMLYKRPTLDRVRNLFILINLGDRIRDENRLLLNVNRQHSVAVPSF